MPKSKKSRGRASHSSMRQARDPRVDAILPSKPPRHPKPFKSLSDINYSMTWTQKLRFISGGSSALFNYTNINMADLLAINVSGAVANTYRLCAAVRLLKVSVSGYNVSGGTPKIRAVIYDGGQTNPTLPGGKPDLFTGQELYPAITSVSARPPPLSPNAQWVNAAVPPATQVPYNVVSIYCSQNDIVEMTVQFVLTYGQFLTGGAYSPIVVGSSHSSNVSTAPWVIWANGGANGLVPQGMGTYY